MSMMRNRQRTWCDGHQARFDARKEATVDLKAKQRFRYLRTVFDPAYA